MNIVSRLTRVSILSTFCRFESPGPNICTYVLVLSGPARAKYFWAAFIPPVGIGMVSAGIFLVQKSYSPNFPKTLYT